MPKHRRHNKPPKLPVRVTPREGGGLALEVGGVTQSIMLPANEDEPTVAPTEIAETTGKAAGTDDAQDEHEAKLRALFGWPNTVEILGGARKDDPALTAWGGQRLRYGYWELLLPLPGAACPQSALILGLGGGTVAALLARRCPQVRMEGVERDAEVVEIATTRFGLVDIPHLMVIQADAFAWVAEQSSQPERYDLICLDLFQGGVLTPGALTTPFLRQLAALLTPGGALTVNLLQTARTPDHLRRLEQIFTIEVILRLYGNVVVHCRRGGAKLSG